MTRNGGAPAAARERDKTTVNSRVGTQIQRVPISLGSLMNKSSPSRV